MTPKSTPHLPLDSARIRKHFPAFARSSLKEHAFFENAGGSYPCQQVLDRLQHYYHHTKVQPYGPYSASIAAGEAMDLAYERIAAALELEADWLHFGPSTSANTYVLAQAFSAILGPGDTIVVTNQDHEANSGVWRRLASNQVTIREWKIHPETGHLAVSDLENLLDKTVRFVAFPHCSNIVGENNPAKEICQKIHAAGALAIVDGVSYAPHGLPDLGDINADIYFFSAYKTYGPHQGIMAIRPEIAASLPNQGHHFNDNKPRYRLTPAGPDHAQIAALAGIADYLEVVAHMAGPEIEGHTAFRIAHNAMQAQEKILMRPLLEWIGDQKNIRLIGPGTVENRGATISLALDISGIDAASRLSKHKIMAGGGHFYGHRPLEALGIDPEFGVLRLSFAHYTSPDEINRLISALETELT